MFDININIDINTGAPTGLSCVAMTVGLNDLNNGRLVVIIIFNIILGARCLKEKDCKDNLINNYCHVTS